MILRRRHNSADVMWRSRVRWVGGYERERENYSKFIRECFEFVDVLLVSWSVFRYVSSIKFQLKHFWGDDWGELVNHPCKRSHLIHIFVDLSRLIKLFFINFSSHHAALHVSYYSDTPCSTAFCFCLFVSGLTGVRETTLLGNSKLLSSAAQLKFWDLLSFFSYTRLNMHEMHENRTDRMLIFPFMRGWMCVAKNGIHAMQRNSVQFLVDKK